LPDTQVIIKQIKPKEGTVIRMYGSNADLKWTWNETAGLTVELPDQASLPCKYVWVLKIEGTEI
jgi:GH18 family chitinase